MSRKKEIMLAIGERLEQGQYINGDFLAENNISLDEISLLEAIGTMIKGLAESDYEVHAAMVFKGCGMSDEQLITFLASHQLPRAAARVVHSMAGL